MVRARQQKTRTRHLPSSRHSATIPSNTVTPAVPSQDYGLKAAEEWFASGEMLASQLPSVSTWSPEKRLAGAVLASTLMEIRDRHSDIQYARRLREDLQWIQSDDAQWPYSFVPLCQLFGLEPEYVREVVNRWLEEPVTRTRRLQAAHRQAA